MSDQNEPNPLSSRARKKAKALIEKAEREKFVQLFQKRMDLAKAGVALYKAEKYSEAAQNYFSYLDILERSKQVKSGGLEPRHFDNKKDIAEMLMLTGVFWDLAKLYDRASRKDASKLDFYLDRFVLFSKGMNYQPLSAEIIRKALVNGNLKNRKKFKDAHIKLGGGKCFVATAVEDYCEPQTLVRLRSFRDQKLLKNIYGKFFVKFYYFVGPSLARAVLRLPEWIQIYIARRIDQISVRLYRYVLGEK